MVKQVREGRSSLRSRDSHSDARSVEMKAIGRGRTIEFLSSTSYPFQFIPFQSLLHTTHPPHTFLEVHYTPNPPSISSQRE